MTPTSGTVGGVAWSRYLNPNTGREFVMVDAPFGLMHVPPAEVPDLIAALRAAVPEPEPAKVTVGWRVRATLSDTDRLYLRFRGDSSTRDRHKARRFESRAEAIQERDLWRAHTRLTPSCIRLVRVVRKGAK